MAWPRRIAHLDMDAFFASVELLRYPDLRGQAVVVGGRNAAPALAASGERRYARLAGYVGRGVVTTSTYEARAHGVFSGMGLMKSAALAPDAILLPADFAAYRHYSRLFKAAVAAIAPKIEDRGIDEIYLDLSDSREDTPQIAQRIKDAVRAATGLSCSIGVAPNKLLAKICSDLEKPDGLTIVGPDDVARRIWPLAVRKINGIGPKAGKRLASLGINTVGELAAAPLATLVRHFGRRSGEWMHAAAHGIDHREVVTETQPKSLSRETTFERDLHAKADRSELSALFSALCVWLAEDLAQKGYLARTIGIKLRYADFSSVTRDCTLPQAIGEAGDIRRAAGQCLKRVALAKRLRLLGVRASTLVPVGAGPAELGLPGGVQQSLPF